MSFLSVFTILFLAIIGAFASPDSKSRLGKAPTDDLPEAAAPEIAAHEAAAEVQPETNLDGCAANCKVHLPPITVYEWQSYKPTATVTVETIVTIVNPNFPGETATSRIPNKDFSDPRTLKDGVPVSRVNLPGITAAKELQYPTGVVDPGTAYWWDGMLPAAGDEPCVIESSQTIQLEPTPAYVLDDMETPAVQVNSESSISEPKGNNHMLVKQVKPAKIDIYQSLYPSEAAIMSCEFIAQPAPASSLLPLEGTAYVTAVVTSTLAGDCKPGVPCQIRSELTDSPATTSTTAGGTEPTPNGRPRNHGPKKPAGAATAHPEKTAQALAGPSPAPETAKPTATATALPAVSAAPVAPHSSSAPVAAPAKPPAGQLDIGTTKVPVSVYVPPSSGENAHAPGLVVVDGSLGSLGQTMTVSNVPVVVTASPDGHALGAVVNAGRADAHDVAVEMTSHGSGVEVLAGHDSGAASHPASIALGDHTLVALNEHDYLLPDGQELHLGGASVTLAGHGDAAPTTVGLVRGKGGRGSVLVVNGASSTLGLEDTAMATGHPGHGFPEESSGEGTQRLPKTYDGAATAVRISWTLAIAVGVGAAAVLL